jgi:carbonic anhydrase
MASTLSPLSSVAAIRGVCPEIIFDCGLGDLFVVRSAGQVGDEAELVSVEFTVQHFGVKLVLIMGHSNCGAVGVAVAGKEVKGRLAKLVSAIQPALERSQTTDVDQCARENVHLQVEQLRRDEQIIKPLVDKGQLKIVGAFYNLATGLVELL